MIFCKPGLGISNKWWCKHVLCNILFLSTITFWIWRDAHAEVDIHLNGRLCHVKLVYGQLNKLIRI